MEYSEELKNFINRRKTLLDNYEIFKFVKDAAWSKYTSLATCERLTGEEEWELFKILKEYEPTYEPDFYLLIVKFDNGNIGFLNKKYNYFTEGPDFNTGFNYKFDSEKEAEEALESYYYNANELNRTKIIDKLILGVK